MEKYHKTDICPVENENERDETYEASNPQIDSERTKDNYHVIGRCGTYTEFINKRIDELDLPTKPRKDAVLMASFVIGSDGEFFNGLTRRQQEQFFAECTRYFADKYGEDNIISAVVHVDETTPHLHLNLMPIRDGRLCCKDLFNRTELTKLQTDFHEAVGKRWGLERGREGSPRKHLSTAEYKAQKIVKNAIMEAAETEKQARQKAEYYLQGVHSAVEAESAKPVPKKKHEVEREIKTLRTANAAYAERLRIKNADSSDLFGQLQKVTRENDKMLPTYEMATEIMSVYPDEFKELLQRARTKKNPPTPFKRNSNGSGKGGK